MRDAVPIGRVASGLGVKRGGRRRKRRCDILAQLCFFVLLGSSVTQISFAAAESAVASSPYEGSLLELLPVECHPTTSEGAELVQAFVDAELAAPPLRRRAVSEPPSELPSPRRVHEAQQGEDQAAISAAILALWAVDSAATDWLDVAARGIDAAPEGACRLVTIKALASILAGDEAQPRADQPALRALLASASAAPVAVWRRLVVHGWLLADTELLLGVAAFGPEPTSRAAGVLMAAIRAERSRLEAWPIAALPEPEEPEEAQELDNDHTWDLWVSAAVLRHLGRFDESLDRSRALLAADPLNVLASLSRLASMMGAGYPGVAAEELGHLRLSAAGDPRIEPHLRRAARALGVE